MAATYIAEFLYKIKLEHCRTSESPRRLAETQGGLPGSGAQVGVRRLEVGAWESAFLPAPKEADTTGQTPGYYRSKHCLKHFKEL